MFRTWAIKKYSVKLLPKLQQRYGRNQYYTASQVRATVYQCNFNDKYLPLGYILFLADNPLNNIMSEEFPNIDISHYKKNILTGIKSSNVGQQLATALN